MALDSATVTILCTTLGTTVTALVLQIMQYLREGRAHKWQVERFEFERIERIRIAADVMNHTNQAAVDTAKVLADKIDDNTQISKAAFKEANDVNNKLVAIGEARLKTGDNADQGRRTTNGHPV